MEGFQISFAFKMWTAKKKVYLYNIRCALAILKPSLALLSAFIIFAKLPVHVIPEIEDERVTALIK